MRHQVRFGDTRKITVNEGEEESLYPAILYSLVENEWTESLIPHRHPDQVRFGDTRRKSAKEGDPSFSLLYYS